MEKNEVQVEAIHPETGEKIVIDIPDLTKEKFDDLLKEHASDEQIKSALLLCLSPTKKGV